MVAAMIEGIVGAGADAIFEHFFAVPGIAGRGATLRENAVEVVIADRVVERGLESRFGALVEIEEHVGTGTADIECVIDHIAAADGEFRFGRGNFCEGHLAAVRGVEFRLDVRVGEEYEVEGLRGSGGVRVGMIQEGNSRECSGGTGGG